MQIIKHDSNRMALEYGHTSDLSGNTTPSQILMFVGMRSMTSQDKEPVRQNYQNTQKTINRRKLATAPRIEAKGRSCGRHLLWSF